MKGMSNAESAAMEAKEEAGVVGVVASSPLGYYDYEKLREGRAPLPCRVEVYPLRAISFLDRWKEMEQRSTRWFLAEEAAGLVMEPDLARFIREFARAYALPMDEAEPPRGIFGIDR